MQSQLPPLPHPVYFVLREGVWDDLITENLPTDQLPPPIEDVYQRFRNAADAWGAQTYIQLKRRGLNVFLVPDFVPNQICVVTYDHLALRALPYSSYVVCCKHDRGRPEICEQRIVQNQLDILNAATDHLMPVWPQPCLKPRDPARQSRVENLVFKGRMIYLATPFRSTEFIADLEALGIQLQVSPDNLEAAYQFWTDYSTADVVIAVRNCTDYDLSIKPPSKLVNAWLAGTPAILGPEPAFQALRQSELDYFEVRQPEEAIAALRRLQDEPGLYQAMVENGRRRAQDFTADRLAERWRDLLAGPIAAGYEQWMQQSLLEQQIGRPLQFGVRCVQHKLERRKFFKNIETGPKPYPD